MVEQTWKNCRKEEKNYAISSPSSIFFPRIHLQLANHLFIPSHPRPRREHVAIIKQIHHPLRRASQRF